MGLLDIPPTRNTTYSPGVSPVKGNDLNAIQDAIVQRGALKELSLPAAHWMAHPSVPATFALSVWQHSGGGGFRLLAPLIFPAGTRVMEITLGYFRGTGSAGCLIARHAIADASQTTRDIIVADNTGAAYENTTITADGAGLAIGGGVGPLIIEAGYAYTLDFAITGGVTGTLGPVRFKYYPGTA